MSGGEGKVVAVTGASGYIASWLVKMLLQRGYTVKASVRDPTDPKKAEALLSFDGAKEKLKLFKGDLLEEGSFDALVDGCEGVFHTASPVKYTSSNVQADILDPAIKGTLNVLKSCVKAKSVKRVVLTSSMATIVCSREAKSDVVIDESWFSDPSYSEELKLWYVLSKTLAEDAAWKFMKEHQIELVAINPALVIGPLALPSVNTTVGVILDIINGAESIPNAMFRWVDVRDVALAHILALETPSATGRYCLVEGNRHWTELVNILQELYPSVKLPDKCVDIDDFPYWNFKLSNERAKSLGINFIPLEVSLKDTVESLKEKNLVNL